MTVYMANLILIGYISVIIGLSSESELRRKRLHNGSSVLVGIVLILVLALRGPSVGVDLNVYLRVWSWAETRDLSEVTRFEPSFVAVTELSRKFSDSPQFFLTAVAILSIAPISYAIRKGSTRPLLSWTIYICLGFYAFTFSGLRQAIAFGLTTLAIHFIRHRKLIPFLLLVCLAWTFHASALIFLPAYWIYGVRISRLAITIYVALVPIIFLFREPIFQWFTEQFYSDYDVDTSSSYNWLLLSAAIVLLAWIQYRSAFSGTDSIANKTDTAGLLQIATIGVTLMLFASVGTNVMRMADYYYVAVIFALPAVLDTLSTRFQLTIKLYLIGALVLVYVIQLMQSPYSIVPYRLFTA